MYREKQATSAPGALMVLVLLALLAASFAWLIHSARQQHAAGALLAVLMLVVDAIAATGLTVVNPNEARVLVRFGRYVGTLRQEGFYWVNPFTTRRRVSLRIRNFESQKLKVNDHDGNPIEIAAIVVWRVVDSAEAMFHVDNYDNFVKVQSESALRNLATSHPYDAREAGQLSLRGNTDDIAAQLKTEVQARLAQAGIEVMEARFSHLAYAPEIAGAMLRRQQASAVVAARSQIVAGAVGMVEMALQELADRHVVELDPERRATMVSNLLVVLCSDHGTQPVVNTGTLYA
ncbi:MAG TPA: SPFH domain-containing protein [Candidatus Eisenbacteria bacterium]|nr:SPFH domain-containing protein [Candidatus Eisenbacteria bacterium]